MAAALLRHALDAQPEALRSLEVVTAGMVARTGEPANDNAVFTMRKAGIDISGHVSRPLTQAMIDRALVVLCMTEAHRSTIAATANPPPPNLWLFREFMPAGADREIPDPYGGPLRAYTACRDEMVEALPSLLAALKRLPR
jgi:protein-tyrosine-phosphatase